MKPLIHPYGGTLINLAGQDPGALQQDAMHLPVLDLNAQAAADVELLVNGAFSPLKGFMGRMDYESVLAQQSLVDGQYWPWPITLEVPENRVAAFASAQRIALRDAEGLLLGVLHMSEIFSVEAVHEAQMLGLPSREGKIHYIAGRIEGAAPLTRHDFSALRLTPAEVRAKLTRLGNSRVVALQMRQPLTRAHYEFAMQSMLMHDAHLLLQPLVGLNEGLAPPEAFALVRAVQAALPRFPAAHTLLSLLPLHVHGLGIRELGLRAIVARNYGVTKLIVGGDHQSRGQLRRGRDIAAESGDIRERVGIELLPFPRMLYVDDADCYVEQECPAPGMSTRRVRSGDMLKSLHMGLPVGPWHVFPEVLKELRRRYPSRDRMGLTVFFTGLSGSGKSTIARALATRLMELGDRPVTLLDGDVVRKHLSSELSFSAEHRDLNIRRIGYVASEITKHRGIAICAPIAPYAKSRRAVRDMVATYGGFFEIHVSTPLEVCEERDCKGLYARARAGLVKSFTGISDPYETPQDPELAIDTSVTNVEASLELIISLLREEGYLRAADTPSSNVSSGSSAKNRADLVIGGSA